MIEKKRALEIRCFALNAISELSKALNASRGRCSTAEEERIKRGIGLSVGTSQTELLDVVCNGYPELNDLK